MEEATILILIPRELIEDAIPDLSDLEEWDETRFAAEMEARQLHALRIRLDKERLLEEIARVDRITNPRLGKNADEGEIRRWLRNGWNTERLLRLTWEEFDAEALSAAVHWAIPMAYYSAFGLAAAFFEAAGYTERSHASIIKRFGELVIAGKYPPVLAFAATGTKKSMVFHAIQEPQRRDSAIRFDPQDPESVEKHIVQFLRSTRVRDLKAKMPDLRFVTKKGEPKKQLAEQEWERVADKVGPTSLMSLLYRKRIKAHYRDIDSLADAGVDAHQVFESLTHVVTCLNFTHEAMIAAGMSFDTFRRLAEDFCEGREAVFLERRLEQVGEVLV